MARAAEREQVREVEWIAAIGKCHLVHLGTSHGSVTHDATYGHLAPDVEGQEAALLDAFDGCNDISASVR